MDDIEGMFEYFKYLPKLYCRLKRYTFSRNVESYTMTLSANHKSLLWNMLYNMLNKNAPLQSKYFQLFSRFFKGNWKELQFF